MSKEQCTIGSGCRCYLPWR